MIPFSFNKFEELPIVAILRGYSAETIYKIAELACDTGIGTLEVTMNTPSAASIIKLLVNRYRGKMQVGAGTVRTTQELKLALDAGAQFIVTPITDVQIIDTCVKSKIPIFSGAYTPTEINLAYQSGASAVKLFPAEIGGLSYFKAVRAPLDHIPIIPTGGIDAENMVSYLEAGAYGFGMGSSLFPRALIEQQDWNGLDEQIAKMVRTYVDWRKNSILIDY